MKNSKYTCEEAIILLQKGNAKHVANDCKALSGAHEYTLEGQEPYAAIVSCADSRVIPENIFCASEGELFVCRVAGNITNTDIIASLEYAVVHTGVRYILVLGHEQCGAVSATIDFVKNPASLGSNLDHLVMQILPAINCHTRDDLPKAVRLNAQLSAKNLLKNSEILTDYHDNYGLGIGWGYYKIYEPDVGKVEGIEKLECSKIA